MILEFGVFQQNRPTADVGVTSTFALASFRSGPKYQHKKHDFSFLLIGVNSFLGGKENHVEGGEVVASHLTGSLSAFWVIERTYSFWS